MRVLIDLGLIKVDRRGRYRAAKSPVTSGYRPDVDSLKRYHHATIRLAEQAIDDIPAGQRQISTLTLGLTKEALDETLEDLGRFRRRALERTRHCRGADRVYQVCLQIFPLTTIRDGKR